LLTTHITDEEAISEAMKGYYTGYSPSILPKANADKYLEALKTKGTCSCKNVSSMGNSLIKDIPDPVVLSVSLTKQPCLHESKFCEINGETMEEEVALKSKILKAIGMSDEAEVLALKSQVTTLEDKIDNMQKDFQEALKSMQEEFTQTLTEALKPVEEVEVAEKSEEAEPETTEEESAEVEVEEEVEEEPEADKAEEVVEEEPVAEKGESKQEPVHDNLKAEKSKPKSVYELMGRYPNGVKIRK
jgi:TolA-binding protein